MRVFVYENILYVWRAETSSIIGLLWLLLLLTTELFLIFIFHSGLLLHGITSCYCGNGDFCAVIGCLLFLSQRLFSCFYKYKVFFYMFLIV